MIGLTSVTFRNKTIEEIIAFSKANAIEGIEWGGDIHVPPNDSTNAAEVGNKTREAGLQVFSYGSYFCLGKGMDIVPVLQTAKALGTNRVRIWAGKVASILISNESRHNLVQEAQSIAAIADTYGIELCFEYHRDSLTDCARSAKLLIEEIGKKNVFLYWQPNPELGEREKREEILLLKHLVKTIHCFYWTGENTRHLLQEGSQYWERYLSLFDTKDIPILLEFCLEDSFENAAKDLNTLRQLNATC
jgi:sugar phosphate isomerase/epimerase